MNGHQLELSLEELANGDHERCAYCHSQFPVVDGKLQKFKGHDGHSYCSVTHASAKYGLAPYLTPRKAVLQ